MEDTLRSHPILTKLQEIADKAARNPDLVFTSLAHLIDVDMLHEAFVRTRKDAAAGGVISPLLANIFLHYVLDEWYVKEIKPRLKGRSFLIRFADDCVIGCELEEDARRIMAVLPKRFARFKLTIHPEKTRLIDFRSPDRRSETRLNHHTFDFLGFTPLLGKI